MADFVEIVRTLEEREKSISAQEDRIRALRVELEKDREAFARVRALMNAPEGHVIYSQPEIKFFKQPTIKDAVAAAVPIVGTVKKIFSSGDIFDHLQTLPDDQRSGFDLEKSRPNISASLRELADGKILMVVKPSAGRRPAIYQLNQGGLVKNLFP